MSVDLQKFPPLYRTQVINDDGLNGHAYVPNGLDVVISDPLGPNPGANPEQFVGLALSTCLNATLEAIETRENRPHTSQVHVYVAMARDYHGFQFYVDAQIRLPGVDQSTAEAWVALAESRCPVAKLLAGSDNVTFHLVEEFSDPT